MESAWDITDALTMSQAFRGWIISTPAGKLCSFQCFLRKHNQPHPYAVAQTLRPCWEQKIPSYSHSDCHLSSTQQSGGIYPPK